MILPFEKVNDLSAVGNKAKNLILLKKEGFNVPNGFVFDCNFYRETLISNGIDKEIKTLVRNASDDNVKEISDKICDLFDSIILDDECCKIIESLAKDGTLYAVRSSADKEDLDDLSFAGQYDSFLNVSKDGIVNALIKCFKSMFSEKALSYILKNNINCDDVSMCVIVQQMVESEYSGVCFTVDPVSGKDTLMLIEAAEGFGENVVGGKTSPKQYYFDWYSDELKSGDTETLSEETIKNAAHVFLKVQLFFGYPCDIEFALKNGELFILQSRMITKIGHSSLDRMWTTADFKDGISACACKMMMWSLYEYAFENALRDFYLKLKMLPPSEIDKKLSNMFYARCYWNLSSVKKALQTVVTFNEQDFENDYGITSVSSDEKKRSHTLAHSLRVYLSYLNEIKDRSKNNQNTAEKLLDRLNVYKEKIENREINDIKQEWYSLTHDDFLRSESNYFSLIFLNTVHRAVDGKKISAYVSDSEKLKLLGNMDNISHMRPFYAYWNLSRMIRKNAKTFELFKNNEPENLLPLLKAENREVYEGFFDLVKEFGYHCDSELDLTRERYSENPVLMLKVLRDTVMLDDSFSPKNDKNKNEKEREAVFSSLEKKFSKSRYRKFCSDIEKERSTLWWREEFRDVSTRYYSMIRLYTIEMSKELLKEGAISDLDDVWFLKVGDVWDYFDKKVSSNQLSDIALKNKTYYNAFRNYTSENEIGTLTKKQSEKESKLCGICANGGQVTGTARVIESFDEIDRIKENDILVTKNTDTGWTPKFAVLSGIVTEYGGALCHCAIVSREYNIPAIVSCEGAMSKIKDGQKITVDGDRAVVITEE